MNITYAKEIVVNSVYRALLNRQGIGKKEKVL